MILIHLYPYGFKWLPPLRFIVDVNITDSSKTFISYIK